MERLIIWVSMILAGFFTITTINLSLCIAANSKIVCHDRERKALLTFKKALIDRQNRLSSWDVDVAENCCKWESVGCDIRSGHVIKLDLRNPNAIWQTEEEYVNMKSFMLVGDTSPSLLELQHLRYLDLSWNYFETIPEFLGSLTSLRYLNLAQSSFIGTIPPQLGNLTNLLHLDLSSNNLMVDNLWWLSRLSSLQYLDMSSVNLVMASDHWLRVINTLPSLLELHLSHCLLRDITPSLGYVNFTSLAVLDLSSNPFSSYTFPSWLYNVSSSSLSHLILRNNNLQGEFPEEIEKFSSLEFLDLSINHMYTKARMPSSLWNLCKLKVLDFSSNEFVGEIIGSASNSSGCIGESLEILTLSNNKLTGLVPDWFGQLKHLKNVDLSANSLSGPIPSSLGSLNSLRYLHLDHNQLNGSLPVTFGELSNLEYLDIGSNVLQGNVSEAHFTKLSKLKVLDLSSNSLTFTINPNWVPPFQIRILEIHQSKMVTGFPSWLGSQNSLEYLDISSAEISDTVPNWFWNFSSHIPYLNLSSNQLHGDLSNVLLNSSFIDLSSNCFEGRLPQLSSEVEELFLSRNSISGTISLQNCTNLKIIDVGDNILSGKIPNWIGEELAYLMILRLRSNKLDGTIPRQLSNLTSLQVLDLSDNNLSGEIPQELSSLSGLFFLNLSWNYLTGKVPENIGGLIRLESLDLSRNSLSGEIPKSLTSMTFLSFLNLSYNNFSGRIPSGSFGKSSYTGNPKLGGHPLTKCCAEDTEPPASPLGEDKDDGDGLLLSWFYAGLAPGFAVGFWGVFGVLIFKRNWRHAYFQLLDQVYVVVVLKFAWLQMKVHKIHPNV